MLARMVGVSRIDAPIDVLSLMAPGTGYNQMKTLAMLLRSSFLSKADLGFSSIVVFQCLDPNI